MSNPEDKKQELQAIINDWQNDQLRGDDLNNAALVAKLESWKEYLSGIDLDSVDLDTYTIIDFDDYVPTT